MRGNPRRISPHLVHAHRAEPFSVEAHATANFAGALPVHSQSDVRGSYRFLNRTWPCAEQSLDFVVRRAGAPDSALHRRVARRTLSRREIWRQLSELSFARSEIYLAMPPRFIARQLSCPTGLFGGVMGLLMNRHNAKMNRFAVRKLAQVMVRRAKARFAKAVSAQGNETLAVVCSRPSSCGGHSHSSLRRKSRDIGAHLVHTHRSKPNSLEAYTRADSSEGLTASRVIRCMWGYPCSGWTRYCTEQSLDFVVRGPGALGGAFHRRLTRRTISCRQIWRKLSELSCPGSEIRLADIGARCVS